jgi:WD40 repeat protein
VNCVDVDASGKNLAASDDDGTILVYDLDASGDGGGGGVDSMDSVEKVERTLRGHGGCVSAVRWRMKRGARECVSASTDCTVMKWDTAVKSVPTRTWDMREIQGCAVHHRGSSGSDASRHEGNFLFGGDGADAMTRAFNPPMAHSLELFRDQANDAQVDDVRRIAVVACGDGTVAMIDIDHGGFSGSTGSGRQKSHSSRRTKGGAFLDGRAECIRLGADGSGGHTAAATCATFASWSPAGDIVSSGGADRRLIAWNWDIARRQSVQTDPDHVIEPLSDASIAPAAPTAGALSAHKASRKINHVACARRRPRVFACDTGSKLTVYALDG